MSERTAARLKDLAVIVVAIAGLWFYWSKYAQLSGLSWWYDNVQRLRTRTVVPPADYDLTSLSWQAVRPRVFETQGGRMTMVTDREPFGYQVFANVKTEGARAADIHFDVDVESGGASIGLLQAGKWIAINSTQKPGAFSDWNSAKLGYHRSLTLAIANDNPAGESRLTVKSVSLFLRR